MTKIKIFRSNDHLTLPDTINAFISDKNVIDVKHTVTNVKNNYGNTLWDSVLVIYDDIKDSDEETHECENCKYSALDSDEYPCDDCDDWDDKWEPRED